MVCAFFGNHVVELIAAPARQALVQFKEGRIDKLREKLRTDPNAFPDNRPREVTRSINARLLARKLKLPEVPDEEWIDLPVRYLPAEDVVNRLEDELRLIRQPGLRTLGPMEAVLVYFKVVLVCGLLLASPWIFWQVWSFVAAGLYPHEKKHVYRYLPFSVLLFLGGAVLCQVFVMPRTVAALFWFNDWLDLEPELRLNEWIGFAVLMPVMFGASFETPLVMLFLDRVGILTVSTYQGRRRQAWFLLAVFAAVITPTPDPVNLMFLWLPLGGLFELGILLCRFWSRPLPDLSFRVHAACAKRSGGC
jgi:sec-independent protein translocase protein TatC